MEKLFALKILLLVISQANAQWPQTQTISIQYGRDFGLLDLAKPLGSSNSFGVEYTLPYFFQTDIILQSQYNLWELKGYEVHHLRGKVGWRYTLLPKLGTALDLGFELHLIQSNFPKDYLLSDKESEFGMGWGWQIFRYTSIDKWLFSLQIKGSQIWTKPTNSWFAGLYLNGGWAW